jgi:outer membrane protein OmpA-like peptidoglycan-associated protein
MKKIITLGLMLIALLMNSQSTPGKHSINNLNINTKEANFGVALFHDDQVIFASPNEKITIIKKVWRENNQRYLDLYVGNIDSLGQIVNKKPLQGDVNKRLHEAMVTFSKDLKTVFFSANNYDDNEKSIRGDSGFDNIQLYKASINEQGEWINIEKLPFNNDDYQSGLPSLNKEGSKLYFVSDRPESIGKTDIYVVDIHGDGTYGTPVNLGPKINTEEREMFPFISDDNILYFSSNGHPGYGNLDVFASKIFDHTVSVPLNLEQPINSSKDDFSYIIQDKKHKGYFASNRAEGKGDDDIYSFNEDEELFIECLQTVKGVVRDKETQALLPGAIVSILDSDGNQLQITAADEDNATYSFEVPCNANYTMVGVYPDYLRLEKSVTTINDLDAPDIELNLDLSTEFKLVGDELLVNIDVIYFDFDKFNIRPDAAKELDKVIEVMTKYPEMKILASSHTDSRGPKNYNMRLSDKRAAATINYIVSKGIDVDRINSQGFGESQLVNDCADGKKCTEDEHQLNRRTNFKVMESFKIRR